jgi:hypothetical protein
VESESDRRVRTVSLTEKGRRVFVPIFLQHAALIKRSFQDVSPDEQRQMEEVLKRIGSRAEELGEQEGHSQDRVFDGPGAPVSLDAIPEAPMRHSLFCRRLRCNRTV